MLFSAAGDEENVGEGRKKRGERKTPSSNGGGVGEMFEWALGGGREATNTHTQSWKERVRMREATKQTREPSETEDGMAACAGGVKMCGAWCGDHVGRAKLALWTAPRARATTPGEVWNFAEVRDGWHGGTVSRACRWVVMSVLSAAGRRGVAAGVLSHATGRTGPLQLHALSSQLHPVHSSPLAATPLGRGFTSAI